MTWQRAAQQWLAAGDRYRMETSRALAGFDCVYCGLPAETVDHVVPRAAGGSDDVGNLVPACRSCNGSKGARSLPAWVEWMRGVQRRLAGAEAVLGRLVPVAVDEFDDPEFLRAWDYADVYRLIEVSGPIFPVAIADDTGIERSHVQQIVARLVETGSVIRTSDGYRVNKEERRSA